MESKKRPSEASSKGPSKMSFFGAYSAEACRESREFRIEGNQKKKPPEIRSGGLYNF
ncbi:hypothetical protein GCM10010465_16930 [Actinomadura fibrosa]